MMSKTIGKETKNARTTASFNASDPKETSNSLLEMLLLAYGKSVCDPRRNKEGAKIALIITIAIAACA
jgi:hypothetical protein